MGLAIFQNICIAIIRIRIPGQKNRVSHIKSRVRQRWQKQINFYMQWKEMGQFINTTQNETYGPRYLNLLTLRTITHLYSVHYYLFSDGIFRQYFINHTNPQSLRSNVRNVQGWPVCDTEYRRGQHYRSSGCVTNSGNKFGSLIK